MRTRRTFLGVALMVLAAAVFVGCGKSSDEQATTVSTPIPVQYGATVLDALTAYATEEKTIIATRDTPYGKEVIAVGGHAATKGTATDDGFVVLVDGQNPGVALDQAYLHTTIGVHTVEVRHVPFGERGENVKPFLVFPIDVR